MSDKDFSLNSWFTYDPSSERASEETLSAEFGAEDLFQNKLRPTVLADYVGQRRVCDSLSIAIGAARARREPLDHLLLYGPPGLGKTTLAAVVAAEMGVNIKTTSGPVIEKPGDLAAILSGLEEGDVLFIDEIHRLARVVEEVLYPAMEDFQVDILIGQGPSARSIKLGLKKFTLIGATTRTGLLTAPLRDRFGIIERMEFYTQTELEQIVTRSSSILQVDSDKAGVSEIAKRSRGTPRIANRLLKRVRDYAEQCADGRITREVARESLLSLGIDDAGLDRMDHQLMTVLIEKFGGGPVGVDTLAAALFEDRSTIEDVYEPYLLKLGFLQRTPRGREATEVARKYFAGLEVFRS